MADLLSLFLFVLFIYIGYMFPIKAGWVVLATVPLLGPTALTLAGSSFLPLTMYRVGYAITFGIAIKAMNMGYPVMATFKIPFVKILILFTLFVFIISIDDRLKNQIFSFIPNHLFAVILPFIMIKDQKSLLRLLNIYVCFAVIVSVTILLETYYSINIAVMIAKTIPAIKEGTERITSVGIEAGRIHQRAGLYTAGGLWGSRVHSGYLMVILFPLTLWYITMKKSHIFSLIKYVPFILSVACLILIQARVALVSATVSLMVIVLLYIVRFLSKKMRKNFLLLSFRIILVLVLVFLLFPQIVDLFSYILNYLYHESFYGGEYSIEGKVIRIPKAWGIFIESPIWGHLVSRSYAYNILMHTDDIPSPIIYMLCGGLILLFIYLFLLIKMPWDTYKLLRSRKIDSEEKNMFIFIIAAFIGGIVADFSSQIEIHLIMMFILYISVYKVYKFKGWFAPSHPFLQKE